MTIILLVLLIGYEARGSASLAVEFNNPVACEKARQVIQGNVNAEARMRDRIVILQCVEKGR